MVGYIFNRKQYKFRDHNGRFVRITARLLGEEVQHYVDNEGLRPHAAIRRLGIDKLNKHAGEVIRQDIGERNLTVHGAVDIAEQWATKEGYDWS
jgi:hypothetical protein